MLPKICSSENCAKRVSARGLCKSHYGKLAHIGQLPPRTTPAQRFWAKVNKTDTCWIWTAHIGSGGYGRFGLDGAVLDTHRVAYEWAIGPIPLGLDIDHICHNKACVNPGHLRTATRKQNMENRTGPQRNNFSSGVRGVSWYEPTEKWRARVKHNKKTMHIGYYDTLDEAERAAIARRNELFTHNTRDRIHA